MILAEDKFLSKGNVRNILKLAAKKFKNDPERGDFILGTIGVKSSRMEVPMHG